MDHSRTLWPVKHHELQKSRGLVGPEDQPTEGIVANLLEKHCMFQGMQDVLWSGVVSQR